MFAFANLRRVSTASTLALRTGTNLRWVPNTLTRSFITSVVRAEPASTTPKTATKTKKPATKKQSTKKTVEKKADEKLVKETKPQRVRIPRDIKIPSYGVSPYIYFASKIFQPELPRTPETFATTAKAASAAWKNLSEEERSKYAEIAKEARVKARQERQEYINSLDTKIIRELNRRRVAKGKGKLRRKAAYPKTAYLLWIKEYVASHPEEFRKFEAPQRLGKIWTSLAEEEKQVYRDRIKAMKEEAQRDSEDQE